MAHPFVRLAKNSVYNIACIVNGADFALLPPRPAWKPCNGSVARSATQAPFPFSPRRAPAGAAA